MVTLSSLDNTKFDERKKKEFKHDSRYKMTIFFMTELSDGFMCKSSFDSSCHEASGSTITQKMRNWVQRVIWVTCSWFR